MIYLITILFKKSKNLERYCKRFFCNLKMAAMKCVSAENDNISIVNLIVTVEGPKEPDTQVPFTSNPAYLPEIFRLISFPDSLSYEAKTTLAKNGLFWNEGRAFCNFCTFSSGSDVTGEHENCPLEGNLPIQDDVTNVRYEANRLLSFSMENWPKMPTATYPVGCLDLAGSGFYYTGTGDTARCAFCRLEIRGWEQGDTAMSEHRRWNPRCPFLEGRAVGNVPLGEEGGLQMDAVVDCAVARSVVEQNLPSAPRYIEDVPILCPPKHAVYVSLETRLQSYTLWPISLHQRPEELSEAGFYYTGRGDRVICHHCGGGLKDWGQTDLPWVEHAVWFPHCSYLITVKGPEFVQQVQGRRNNMLELTTPPANSRHVQTSDEEPLTPVRTGLSPARSCKVCLDKELGVVFLPCGHIASCTDCAPQLSNCPICRATVTAYVRACLP